MEGFAFHATHAGTRELRTAQVLPRRSEPVSPVVRWELQSQPLADLTGLWQVTGGFDGCQGLDVVKLDQSRTTPHLTGWALCPPLGSPISSRAHEPT